MVDAPQIPDQQPNPPETGTTQSFIATPTGRWVVGGVGAVVLLVLVGVAGWFVYSMMMSPSGTSTPSVTTVVKPGGGTSTSVAASESAPITEPAEKPLGSTFTFRNVFAPTLKQPVAAASTSSSSGSSSSSSSSSASTIDVPADTLYLVSIQTVDGERMATFIWNDKSYTLGVGDGISGTPWKVLQINSSSVVMLYGDTEVTLTTGQGLSK